METVVRQVHTQADVDALRRSAAAAALDLGGTAEMVGNTALVVAELATNLLRHARSGQVRLSAATADGRRGLFIESLDLGPGIADIERALTDGYSSAGGLGAGLPMVRRLASDFRLESSASGTTISVTMWTN